MISLFAYTKVAAHRIVRFELDAKVQAELSCYLTAQADEFDKGCHEFPFDGKFKPDQDQLLYIDDFDDLDNLAGKVAAPLAVPLIPQDDEFLSEIKALFFGIERDGVWVVYLQAFDRRKLISNKGFSLFHEGHVYKRVDGAGITLDGRVAAKLHGEKLSFRSFFLARQIFDLSKYYLEATDADIAEFSKIAQVAVADVDAFKQVSDSWVRRKLWLVQQSKILEKVTPADLKVAALEFGLSIKYQDNDDGVSVLLIPDDKKELKSLLRFLDEDYYTSPLSKTNFMTNSKVRIDKK